MLNVGSVRFGLIKVTIKWLENRPYLLCMDPISLNIISKAIGSQNISPYIMIIILCHDTATQCAEFMPSDTPIALNDLFFSPFFTHSSYSYIPSSFTLP